MAKLVCAKPHFGAGGVQIPAGTEIESKAKADGVYWVEAESDAETEEEGGEAETEGDKKLEVATPSKAPAKGGK